MLLLALQRKKHTEHFRLLQRKRTGWTFDREAVEMSEGYPVTFLNVEMSNLDLDVSPTQEDNWLCLLQMVV